MWQPSDHMTKTSRNGLTDFSISNLIQTTHKQTRRPLTAISWLYIGYCWPKKSTSENIGACCTLGLWVAMDTIKQHIHETSNQYAYTIYATSFRNLVGHYYEKHGKLSIVCCFWQSLLQYFIQDQTTGWGSDVQMLLWYSPTLTSWGQHF